MKPTSSDPPPQEAAAVVGPARRSARRILPRLALVVLALAVALLLVEVGIRLFLDVTDIPVFTWDPVVGVRRAPDQSGYHIRGREIHAPYHFNAQGWNHLEDFEKPRPPDRTRVCIVGDSYVEALQVPPEKAMHRVAERTMVDRGRSAQWYPFGCSGFGTARNYLVIRDHILDYRPDVVIMFCNQNDPFDCSPYLLPKNAPHPTFDLDRDGRLSLIPASPWKAGMLKRIAIHSALVRLLYLQTGTLNPRKLGRMGAARRLIDASGGSGDLPNRKRGVGLRIEERYEKTWKIIEALILASKEECDRAGAIFAVVFRGNREEIEAAEAGRAYSAPPPEVDPYCLGQRIDLMGRTYFETIARRQGVAYLDLTPALCAKVREAGAPHAWIHDSHYNELGHEAAGEALAAFVEQLLAKRSEGAGSRSR